MPEKKDQQKSKERVQKLIVQTDLSKSCMTFLEWQEFMNKIPLFQESEKISTFLKILSNPIRLGIILILLEREWGCNCEFEYAFEAHQTLISHHLKLLREEKILEYTKSGPWIFYKLTTDAREFFLRFRALFLESSFVKSR